MWRTSLALFLRCSLGGALSSLCLAQGTALAQADELVPLAAAIDANPSAAEVYDAYVAAAFRAKRWDEAIARLKVAVAKIPTYHAGYYKLGYAYRQKKAWSESVVAYVKFAELEPGKSDPYFGLGASLQGAGDRPAAVEAYKRYVELEKAPEKQKFVEQAKGEIARLSAVVPPPRPAAAVSPGPAPAVAARPATAASGPRSEALALRADADKLRAAGKLDEASAAYERALAADPGNLDLHVELGDAYFAQKRYTDAAKVFRAAVDRDPGYALGWYNLAHAESRAGQNGTAVLAYHAYMKLRPTDPDPYYGLGQAEKAAGNIKAAIEAFRAYLAMERRPESQRWVERARKELEALESGPRTWMHTRDLKNPFEDRPAYASADDLLPPGGEGAVGAARERIQRELAADDILPIDGELARPEPTAPLPEGAAASNRDRLARYASALAAYRVALDRQASEVAGLYQRGTERLIANDLRGAQRLWSSSSAADRAVDEARVRLDKARALLK